MVSVAATCAPVRCTSMVNIRPIGPCPMTTTTSSGCGSHCTTAFRQVLSGSTRVARSNETPSGIVLHAALHDPIHHPHVLGKSAARRFETRGDPHLLVNGALRVDFAMAVKTVQAGNVVEGHHAVAGFEFGNARAHGGHHAGGFMPINARRRQQVVFDLLEVGMADSAGFHADQNFAGPNGRSGNLFDGDDTLASINRRVHGVGDCASVRIGNRQKTLPMPSRGLDTPASQPDQFRKPDKRMAQHTLQKFDCIEVSVLAEGRVEIVGHSLPRQICYDLYAIERQAVRAGTFGHCRRPPSPPRSRRRNGVFGAPPRGLRHAIEYDSHDSPFGALSSCSTGLHG